MELFGLIAKGLWLTFLLAVNVYAVRRALIGNRFRQASEKVILLSKKDVESGRPYEWRVDELLALDINGMLIPFWRPIKPYFDSLECLKEDGIATNNGRFINEA